MTTLVIGSGADRFAGRTHSCRARGEARADGLCGATQATVKLSIWPR
jgi:hypothetical protein